MSTGPASVEPPHPEGAVSVDDLVMRLQELRAWAGYSYRQLHRRLVQRRRNAGIAEEPAYATVYRCLQPGRSRLDIELVVDIVAALTGTEVEAARWRQAYARLSGESMATAYATVHDRLPEDVDDFTGRDDELSALLDQATLDNDRVTVLAIEGMAGVGKTTLAVRAARRLIADHRPDVVLSVNLYGYDPDRTPVDPLAVLDGFLRLLGEPGPRIQTLALSARTARYRWLLAGRRALVLLDNAASTAQIDPLLPAHSSVLTLVTSRRRVVEHPDAQHLSLGVFTSDQAIKLLRRRAGDDVDADPATAAQIAIEVGHLPLAVALVAARINATPDWSLRDHLDHLVECRQALQLDAGVELAFTTSYGALPHPLQRMLRLLALHRGRDCDAYAAAAISGVSLAAAKQQLTDLADASLARTRDSDRYELHDLVRIYALNRARDDDPPSARRAALTRLLDYYRWATTVAMDVYAPEERHRRPEVPTCDSAVPTINDRATAITWLEAERPNLVAIGTYAADHGWAEHISALSAVLAPYLINAAHFADADRIHRHASRSTSGAARAVALKNLATASWFGGARTEALALFQQSAEIAETSRDYANLLRVLNNLGNVYEHLGRYGDALDTRRRALRYALDRRDRVSQGRILLNLGRTTAALGLCECAIGELEQALSISDSFEDRTNQARVTENLSRLYNNMGRYDLGRMYAEKAIDVARGIGERVSESDALVGLGTALAGAGDLRTGEKRQRDGLLIAQEIGSSASEIYARQELGTTLRRRGALVEALEHHHRALAMSEGLDDTPGMAAAHEALGHAYAAMGDDSAARLEWLAAHRLYRRIGRPEATDVQAELDTLDTAVGARTALEDRGS